MHRIKKTQDRKWNLDRSLLIIAHPDDESMFFGPVITEVLNESGRISIVVCTDGGKGGIPEVRKKEMTSFGLEYGIPIFFLGYPDGSLKNSIEIQKKIFTIHTLTESRAIITFDNKGASGHKDHKECYILGKSVAKTIEVPIYTLKTFGIIEKYVYPLLAHIETYSKSYIVVSNFKDSLRNRLRMFYHPSQMVWYRYLYILFSFYMDYNTLREIEAKFP